MELNNREISFLIWAATFFCFASLKGEVREAFGRVFYALFQKKIVLSLTLAAIWITACIWALAQIGIWGSDNLKSTLVWAAAFAFVTMFDVSRISEDNTYFRKTVRDTINATVAVTFIAELYTYSLTVELLMIPLLTMAALMQVMAKNNPEQAPVEKLSTAVLVIAGFSYLGHGIYQATTNFQDFMTWFNFREFINPILLSLLFLPFLYLFSIYVTYESNILRLHWLIKDNALRRYATCQAAIKFRFDLDLLRRWARELTVCQPSTRDEIRESINRIKLRKARERHPHHVDKKDGWSPSIAKNFLIAISLSTHDYHPSYDGMWFANSSMVELGGGFLPNNIAYYVEGDEQAAKRLKIILNINHPIDCADSESHFQNACDKLFNMAIGEIPHNLHEQIRGFQELYFVHLGRRIRLTKKDFMGGVNSGYSRILTIDHSPDYQSAI